MPETLACESRPAHPFTPLPKQESVPPQRKVKARQLPRGTKNNESPRIRPRAYPSPVTERAEQRTDHRDRGAEAPGPRVRDGADRLRRRTWGPQGERLR